jgi:hypothetical protein
MNLRHGAASTLSYIVVVYANHLGAQCTFADIDAAEQSGHGRFLWLLLAASRRLSLERWASSLPMVGICSV